MKQQEPLSAGRPASDALSPDASVSGKLRLTFFIRALATALGFALSAGWDWLPSMHSLWLRDYTRLFGQPGSSGGLETFSGIIFFKILMLLLLCPLIERLFLAFPMEKNARTWVAPGHEAALMSPRTGERLYIMFPLMLVQGAAIALAGLASLFMPSSLHILYPWIIGTTSALFGLVWFVLIALLPGAWGCLAYAFTLCSSAVLAPLLDEASVQTLGRLRILLPLLAVPLLFFAVPPGDDILRRVSRHRRQRLFSTRMRGVFLRNLLLHRVSLLGALSKSGNGLLVFFLFPVFYGLQQLLDFSSGCPLICIRQLSNPPLQQHVFVSLSGQASGAFLAATFLAFFPGHHLLVPMLGLSLFGCGTLLTSVLPTPPFNSLPFYLMQLAAGLCAAFALYILHCFFERSNFLFRTVSRSLVLLTLLGSVGGYLLWMVAESINNHFLGSHALFMHLLTLLSIAALFCIYLVREPLIRLLDPKAAARNERLVFLGSLPPADPLESLTPREREVAELVGTGMKNLEISLRLNISETTLRVHLRRIYRKLGIRGRANLRDFNYPG